MSFFTSNRPSPSDIFRSPAVLTTPGAIYDVVMVTYADGTVGWRGRVGHIWLGPLWSDLQGIARPVFTVDPVIQAMSIPGSLSMDPVFDKQHHNFYIEPVAVDRGRFLDWLEVELKYGFGNIVVYSIPQKMYAVHRLVAVNRDTQGRKWWFRGDNNFAFFFNVQDPYPARDENIWWVYAGTIC